MAYEGILFRTDGAWGAGKGSRLTAVQVDENFYTLAVKVKDIQDNPPEPNEIAQFQVVGSQLMVFMADGTQYGPFTLPVAAMAFRDEWLPDTPYFELDLTSVAGYGLFLVRLNHTSDATFDPNATDDDGNLLYLKVFGDPPAVYTFGFFYPGLPGTGMAPGDMLAAHLFNEPVYIESTEESRAALRVASAAAITCNIYKNADAIGTITFSTADPIGTVSFSADVQFAAGDVCYIEYPDDGIDASARDLTVTIKAFRGSIPS